MTETNATALPCRIKIDIHATTTRELMTQLFDIYHLYNSEESPGPTARDVSADHIWTVHFSGPKT